MKDTCERLRESEDVKEFFLGMKDEGGVAGPWGAAAPLEGQLVWTRVTGLAAFCSSR